MHPILGKSFIVYVAQKLFKSWGLESAYFISNEVRAHLKKHFIRLPWIHDITFDYNSTWKELGGKKLNNGWYLLPLTPQRKTLEEIKSKKRSEYKKRYMLLDNCLVPQSYGIIPKNLKEINLWEIYCILMPRQRLESEKKYKNLRRASLS